MTDAPDKKCDYCDTVGRMPTFRDNEQVCFECLAKGDRRKWKEEDVRAWLADHGMTAVPTTLKEGPPNWAVGFECGCQPTLGHERGNKNKMAYETLVRWAGGEKP